MWYKDLGIISIGAQCGGPIDNGVSTIKIDLCRLFRKYCTSTYCPAVDHYALALRVGGKFLDYTPELIHKVRRSRKERYIGCDIDIPVAIWEPQTTDQLKNYLANKVREAIEILVKRLEKDKETVDSEKLFSEIDNAIGVFKTNHYENID